jgi:alpha-1,3/alpha-1,6-mannosyltransferase
MINGVPAIGINNGGPKETIADGETGYLLDTSPKSWAEKLQHLVACAERD